MQPRILKAEDLKPDQVEGVETMLAFVEDDYATELLVEGPAGCGKTSMLRVGIEQLPEEMREGAVICAPTNKAVKVARELSNGEVETTTIYKLLGLSLQHDGGVKVLKQSEQAYQRLMATTLVVLDEGSMVSEQLKPEIRKAQDEYGIKFVYVADRYQLPPVGEELSWVFDTQKQFRLSTVKRHDNAILNLATHLREVMDAGGRGLKVVEDFNDDAGGVELFKKGKAFDEYLIDTWSQLAADGNRDFSSHRALAWTNSRVEGYNDLVREMLYGRRESRDNALMVGERVVVCNPVKSLQDETQTLMYTDEEGFIEKISIGVHPHYGEIECFMLTIVKESTNTPVGVYAPTPRGWKVANRMLNNFKSKALNDDRIFWGAFFTLKEWMNDVRPCHALTTHRSQGSTFQETFVDLDNILANSNRMEALKSAYVAITRASHKVNVRWSGF